MEKKNNIKDNIEDDINKFNIFNESIAENIKKLLTQNITFQKYIIHQDKIIKKKKQEISEFDKRIRKYDFLFGLQQNAIKMTENTPESKQSVKDKLYTQIQDYIKLHNNIKEKYKKKIEEIYTKPNCDTIKLEKAFKELQEHVEDTTNAVNINLILNYKAGGNNTKYINYTKENNHYLGGKDFKYGFFNTILNKDANTTDENQKIYNATLNEKVDKLISGPEKKNIVVFAYGGSGSGKTSLLLGDSSNNIKGLVDIVLDKVNNIEEKGIADSIDVNVYYAKSIVDKNITNQITIDKNIESKKISGHISKPKSCSNFILRTLIYDKLLIKTEKNIKKNTEFIKPTPLNPESSRCAIEIIFNLKDNKKIVFIDLPGSENPVQFFYNYISTKAGYDILKKLANEYKGLLNSECKTDKTNITIDDIYQYSPKKLNEIFVPITNLYKTFACGEYSGKIYNNQTVTYENTWDTSITRLKIHDILAEGFYINELLNKLKILLRRKQGIAKETQGTELNNVIAYRPKKGGELVDNYDPLTSSLYTYDILTKTNDLLLTNIFTNYNNDNSKFVMYGCFNNTQLPETDENKIQNQINHELNINTLEYISDMQKPEQTTEQKRE